MTQPAAGWYPDPGGSGGQRWWNGQSWSDSVQPAPAAPVAAGAQPAPAAATSPEVPTAPAYAAPPYNGPPGYTPYPPSNQRGRGMGRVGTGNRNAFITIVIVAVYLVIAAETRIVFFGILPLAYAMRSRAAREPLWPLALAASIVAIIIAAALIFGH